MENQIAPQISPWRAWILAARPKTLPAAASPVIAATALAWAEGHFHWGAALAALTGALLLQIGANLANDYFDYQKGVDTVGRLGPLRVTQAGLLKPHHVLAGTLVVFGLASLIGVYLIALAGWPVALIGLASILAALAYTGGPRPYGYSGWGEVAVFLFFGLAAVVGTYYIQARQVSAGAVALSIPIGLLIVNILVVNNLRDIPTDRATGKHTLAVRYGETWTRCEYLALLITTYLVSILASVVGILPLGGMLALASLPLAIRVTQGVWLNQGRALNRSLAESARLVLVFSLLFSLGVVFEKILLH
ncbi:1,4-dihydroxy-2-naphthoate polyprenyltransferase [uncultured Thermanaerothrix sp.]|uniref:1,4-dihydroxy-2-naphthoate polyprenyltransferase n=1 Tax=uncultured Thermanaerothrix sp. TaxID=1195149 RepID=UPI002617D73E|nr:1,4-dihydroxy-2-naphthoate polyprenyltransferase [uncultured Thermanaerothrix sp.]